MLTADRRTITSLWISGVQEVIIIEVIDDLQKKSYLNFLVLISLLQIYSHHLEQLPKSIARVIKLINFKNLLAIT